MDIKNYEGIYKIFEDGTIINKYNKVLFTVISDGYHRTRLCKNKQYKNVFIHRLIAEHYLPNPDNKPFVDHIDGNRLNNSLTNLRWVTSCENNRNRKQHNKNGYKGVYRRSNGKYYSQIKIDGKNISLGTFDSVEQASEAYNQKAMELYGMYAKN